MQEMEQKVPICSLYLLSVKVGVKLHCMLSNVGKNSIFSYRYCLDVHIYARGICQSVFWWFYYHFAVISHDVEILTLSENRLFFQLQKLCSNFYESEAYPGPKNYTKR